MYAIMGGFVLDSRNSTENYLPDGRQRMTLSPDGLEFIAKHHPDLILDISETEIQDKSKANAFTKILTCGQAIWFGIQCLTRWMQGLSVSLLEINTTVHAACALVLYFGLSWEKPLDVYEPTPCTHPDIHILGSYIAVGHHLQQLVLLPKRMLADKETETCTRVYQ
jgi:hypothetical protein